jgi:tetratricopeptide (TPR) repeat protein
MRRDLQGATGFMPQNWQAAAQFCLDNNYNLEEALVWAENSVSAPFGSPNMPGYTVKAQILEKMNKPEEAEKVMQKALESGSISELHQYGRQLLNQKKPQKALEVFQLNYKKHGDAWPVHVGLARGYSATGDLKKALEHAKTARAQAPDDLNKTSLDGMIKTLESGKAIAQ